MATNKLTIPDILLKKEHKHPITALTAYDYPWAKILDEAGIDILLVGDSLGMVVLGYPSTVCVTMDEMIHHTKAVSRAVTRALVIGDMPFGSYNCTEEKTIQNATRFLKEAGADAVKLEGGTEVAKTIQALVKAGIPVQGHIGLTPQTASSLGGMKVQGKDIDAAKALIADAQALEAAGCFSIVLEAIPTQLADIITAEITIPTIGIGAGIGCDGQILVTHDLVGLFDKFTPKFVKQYTRISDDIRQAVSQYKTEVEAMDFPQKEHSFFMNREEEEKLDNI